MVGRNEFFVLNFLEVGVDDGILKEIVQIADVDWRKGAQHEYSAWSIFFLDGVDVWEGFEKGADGHTNIILIAGIGIDPLIDDAVWIKCFNEVLIVFLGVENGGSSGIEWWRWVDDDNVVFLVGEKSVVSSIVDDDFSLGVI